jgi:hypothetical protein
VFIRIIATPPGEAPEEVRRAWVGLELPLAAGEAGPRTAPVGGVLTGARTFLGKLFNLLTGRRRYAYGYRIDAPQALLLLAEKSPGAAQWWRECAPHCWQPGHVFLFPAEACAEVAAWGPGLPPPDPAAPPSEGVFPAGSPEVTRNPTPRTAHAPDAGRPAPDTGRDFRVGGAPESRRLTVTECAVLECVGWIGCGSSVLFALADLLSGCYGLLVVRACFLAVGVLLVLSARANLRRIGPETEPPGRKAAPAPDRPAKAAAEPLGAAEGLKPPPEGAAKEDFWPRPAQPTFTLETRGGTFDVEPTLLEPRMSWGRAQCVQRSPDCLEVVPSRSPRLVVFLVLFMFLLVFWHLTLGGGASVARHPRADGAAVAYVIFPLLQLTAVAIATLGLAAVTQRFRIDRGAGEVHRSWFFRERIVCRVGDFLAVQVVGQCSGRRSLYQVNLVLSDPDRPRVNLVSHDSTDPRGQTALWLGRRLAAFLGKPLADQLEAMALLGPAELADLFALDRLAGPHNVELTESPFGVLELKPVPYRGAPFTGVWGDNLFHRACASVKFDRVKFDRNPGGPPRLFVRMPPGTGLFRLPDAWRKPRRLQDLVAVELAADTEGQPDGSGAASRPTCRLWLRLRDASGPVLELAPHADEAWARETGGRLARFLGAPLEDRTRPEAAS